MKIKFDSVNREFTGSMDYQSFYDANHSELLNYYGSEVEDPDIAEKLVEDNAEDIKETMIELYAIRLDLNDWVEK